MKRFASAAAAFTLAASVALAGRAATKDYILTVTKPNALIVADAAARKVVKTIDIPGRGSPGAVVPSPDGRIAYVLTNGWESIAGIDLDSGRQVFRADFPEPGVRIKGVFGFTISPDGSELFVVQSQTRLGLGEYQVLDGRIAVYRTGDGVGARPVRLLPVPRRTVLLLMARDGSKLYAVSWNIHVIDPRSGRELDVLTVADWGRKDFSPPDVFGVWQQFEQAQVFVNPYFTTRTDLDPSNPAAYRTGLLTLDLATGAMEMKEFENSEAILFSSVINPVRRNEAYSVYTQLSKTDLGTSTLVKRVPLEHTYYTINVSSDGREIYVGGTMSDIGVYSSDTLEKIGVIEIPSGNDMGTAWLRVVRR